MQITVYSDFKKRRNSTKQPSGGTSIDCVLKAPTSRLNPTFVISGFNLKWNYIQWDGKFYYVDDIVIVTNDIANYMCSVDVLATYKTEIGNDSEYVTRAASSFDGNVCDMQYPTKSQYTTRVERLSNIANGMSVNEGTYVIGVKSKDSYNGVAFYGMYPIDLYQLVEYLYSDVWLDATDITKSLQKILIDPFDYIVSVNWYPFDVCTGTSENIYFGYWDSHVSGYKIDSSNRIKSFTDILSLPHHPQEARGNYLNGSPYTQVYLTCFTFGRVALDPNVFLNTHQCTVYLDVDLYTGIGMLMLTSGGACVHVASATVSVPIQLSQVKNDLLTPLISAAGGGAMLATGNVLGFASNIGNAIMNAMPQISSIGCVGSVAPYASLDADIEFRFYHILDEDLATMGRPLCQVKRISTLSGFVKCENVDIIIAGTPNEKQQIVDYMENGFFYE